MVASSEVGLSEEQLTDVFKITSSFSVESLSNEVFLYGSEDEQEYRSDIEEEE